MANSLIGSIFSRKAVNDISSRMDQNDWAAQWFTYGGNAYPIQNDTLNTSASFEESTQFQEYVDRCYKGSGIVFAVVEARRTVFVNARFQYQKLKNGRPGELFGKPELSLLETPWENGTTTDLLSRALQDTDCGGNFYCVREGTGSVKNPYRLRRLRPDWVWIVLTKPPAEAVKSDVAGYIYKPDNTPDKKKWETYPIDGSNGVVAHWAPIPDPSAQYRGMSWMTAVMTEITSDRAMVRHKQKFFENAATPAITVSLNEKVTKKQYDEFIRGVNNSSAGVDNAYRTLFLGGGADVKVIGSTLQQMDFTKTAGHGETRICSAARVPPQIVGVAENMHGSELSQSNYQPAKDMFIDGTIRGLWTGISAALAVLVPKLSNARLWYDDRDIPFLRQDRKDVAEIQGAEMTILVQGVTSGWTPDSCVKALKEKDWSLLKHTGLFSVQLQPPGGAQPLDPTAPLLPDGTAPPAPSATAPKGDANTPDKQDSGPEDANPTDDTD